MTPSSPGPGGYPEETLEKVASRAFLREAIFSHIWHIFPNFWNNA
jgi:hypothetical protein